jgi:hypothetical protein
MWFHDMAPSGERMPGMEHVTPEPGEDSLPTNTAALTGGPAALALAFEPFAS